ncbi:MAG: GNAT family N-acetyltransferase [Roseateles sp.]|uniref:GNAT family N-acetyltransferase n=1 Tax=Roseateles sp. TaxID=1971397 RepID=UPI0039ECC967
MTPKPAQPHRDDGHGAQAIDPALFAQGCVGADPNFFAALGLTAARLQPVATALLAEPMSDCFGPHLVLDNAKLAGFLCAYRFPEMFSRQATTLKMLLPYCDADWAAIKQRLRDLQRSKADIRTPDSLYLAKLFVAPHARGRGCGDRLMRLLHSVALQSPGVKAIALHVRRDNPAARRLYERHEFAVVGEPAHDYLAMERSL